MVELSHDSRPIIGRGPPLGATFLTLALLSVGLMVADVRYDQMARVRELLSGAAYPLQVAVDLPIPMVEITTKGTAAKNGFQSPRRLS